MDNILTYAKTKLNGFEELPFNAVDSLILSWISYLHLPWAKGWQGVRLAELFKSERFEEMFSDVLEPESSMELFTAMASSPRFRDIYVKGYTEQTDPQREKQFSALCYQLTGDSCYVAFRGTDTTLIGWKEDFNMAFQYPVPSQESAALYLKNAEALCRGSIRLGGHSKGGNLAVYAAANCDRKLQEKIVQIYSHDGPGFIEAVFAKPEFRHIEKKIHKTIPQSSIVGLMLEHQERFKIVKSNRISIWQHNPFSWKVKDNDFHYLDKITSDARYVDNTINEWIQGLSTEERERFVDELYALIGADDTETYTEFMSDWRRRLPKMVKAASKLDDNTRDFLIKTVKQLAALSIRNFPDLLKKE